jgi:hypothetical protein
VNKETYWKLMRQIQRKLDPYPHMSYVKKNRFLFIHIPKTAGTSILDALSINFRHHSDYKVFKSANTPLFNKAYKFCFVRNPYDRLFSVYSYLLRGGSGHTDKALTHYLQSNSTSFETFVENVLDHNLMQTHPLFKPQFAYVCDFKSKIMVDFVGRFESLPQDIKVISKAIGQNIELPHLNSNKKDAFCSVYNEGIAKKVYSLYQKDFELFDYSVDSYKAS